MISGSCLLRRHRAAGDVGYQRHVLARGEAGDQVVELEHEADVVAPVFGQPAIVELVDALVTSLMP
ncbi:MAG: hypothetical protein ABI475_05860 [Methylophilaceae bacterium]